MDRLIEKTFESKDLNIFIATTRNPDKPFSIIVDKKGVKKSYPVATVDATIRMAEYLNDRLYVII